MTDLKTDRATLRGTPLSWRDMMPADLAEAHALSLALGWPHRAEDWRQMLELGSGIVARDAAGALVGTGLAWHWGSDTATLGLILVQPHWQGQGVGRLLVEHLMARTVGCHLRLSATEAGLRLYESAGFVRVGSVRQYQGLAARRAPAAHVRAIASADRAALIALDAATYGGARSALVDVLLCTGEGVAIERDGRLVAFGFRRRFGRGALIGPVVAASSGDACAVIESLLCDGFNRIDIPDAASALLPLLADAGLKLVDTVVVMTAGGWPATTGEARVFALASQAFG